MGTPAHEHPAAAHAPLTPDERVEYARAMKPAQAIFVLEGMHPPAQDLAIDPAILAGRVAPEQAREELLAYITLHKKIDGFIETRPWRCPVDGETGSNAVNVDGN